jgi:flagellar basal-body rod modification protein FlgD
MATIDTSTLNSLGISQSGSSGQAKDRLGQSEFLKLMTTQLNNQDPMSPMDNGQFYGQIAQFSTVAGIQDLQASFQQMATALYSNQALQASTLVGRDVMVSSSQVTLAAGGNVSGAVDVPVATSQLAVNIYDQAGQLVRRVDLGAQSAGQSDFNWDGTRADGSAAPPGKYFIGSDMLYNGQSVALETLVSARIDSVTMDRSTNGTMLNLSGGGQVELANVRQFS